MQKWIADSSCDVPGLQQNTMGVELVPLRITIDERTYVDDGSVTSQQLVDAMRQSPNAPRTACPSVGDYEAAMSGDDDAFVVTLSSHLSGSYESAVSAQKIKKGSGRVHVFDSKSASAGQVRIMLEALRHHKAGCTFEQIAQKVGGFIEQMDTFFVLQSLDNLIKAGRMSRLVGSVASLLQMRHIIGAEDGKIVLVQKARGTRRSMESLCEIILRRAEHKQQIHAVADTLVIAHCNCMERAQELRNTILQKTNIIRDVVVVKMGGLSTTYAGDGGIVIGY